MSTASDRALLYFPQVQALTGLSRDSIGELVAARRFPRPLPLGPWTWGWDRHAIEAWLRDEQNPAAPV